MTVLLVVVVLRELAKHQCQDVALWRNHLAFAGGQLFVRWRHQAHRYLEAVHPASPPHGCGVGQVEGHAKECHLKCWLLCATDQIGVLVEEIALVDFLPNTSSFCIVLVNPIMND